MNTSDAPARPRVVVVVGAGMAGLATVNRMITGLKYLWWHLSHENTNRVLIEPEPATPPPAAPTVSPQTRQCQNGMPIPHATGPW